MTLTIDVKKSAVLTLLRDMKRLDLLRVTTRDAAVSLVSAQFKMTGAEELEYINRNADRPNGEAGDVCVRGPLPTTYVSAVVENSVRRPCAYSSRRRQDIALFRTTLFINKAASQLFTAVPWQ